MATYDFNAFKIGDSKNFGMMQHPKYGRAVAFYYLAISPLKDYQNSSRSMLRLFHSYRKNAEITY